MEKRLTMFMMSLFLFVGGALAQTKVSGTVYSQEDGQPIIGAAVKVDGTSTGMLTDVNGKFSLTLPAGKTQLTVSYLGYESKTVAAKNGMRVFLQSDAAALDEVIVVAYGTAKKSAFTGSASTVNSESLEKRQVSNVTQALSGAVAGVQILSNNGQPGESATVRVRGVGSINASANPLYVVDGIPFDGDIATINTQDIESMTVLKDAASTSLYGARGANGVIIITTKKGKVGTVKVSFDGRVGINQRATSNYDVFQRPDSYIEKAYEALYNAGIYNLNYTPAQANIYANQVLPTNASGGLGYQIYTVPAGQQVIGLDGKLNPNATLGYSDGDYYYTPDNWTDETYSNKTRQEYNLNISGGGDKMTYYISLGYLDDKGLIENSGFQRYSFRVKGDYDVTKWLKVGANVSYAYTNSTYPDDQTATNSSGNAFLLANQIAPVYPMFVRNPDGSKLIDNRGREVYDYGDGQSSNGNRSFMSIANPVGNLLYNVEEYLADVLSTNWNVTINPLDGLRLTARIGADIDNTRYNTLGNPYYGQFAPTGYVYQYHYRTSGLDYQYIINYTKTFADVHNLDAMVGYDGYERKMAYIAASGDNLYNPTLAVVSNTIDQKNGYGYNNSYSTAGFIGRANYDYDGRYFASLSFRRDGSSRFHKDNRWGNFWSASAAWVMNKEKFIQNIKWIDFLKLKASYGENGNDNVGNYYAYVDQYTMSGANGVFSDGTLSYKGNKELTWEKQKAFNIGVDFELFKGKLGGTIEYFSRKITDMLYNKPVSPSAGYSSIPMNIGAMTNSGLEIDLHSKIMKTANVEWDVNLNATFIKNKINELHPDLNGELIDGTRIYTEGESMYRMYLVRWAGVDSETGLAQYWAKDENDQEYKTSDWQVASNTNKQATDNLMPKVYGGFGTTVKAYGFDASIQCAYQLGGKIYDSGYARFMHGGTSSFAGTNWHKDIQNAWTPSNTNTDVPRLDAQDKYANSTSDRWMTKSNYLALNNITIGYTLPRKLLNTLHMEKIRVYFAADNVGIIAARKGLDPRQSYVSATNALYTPIRSISGGINVTF